MPDGNPIDIQIIRPVSDDQIKTQVAYALSLGLPEVQRGPVTHDRLYIYANGPSAATAPLNQPAMALNGAIKLFVYSAMPHVYANYWAACDPQEVVASFCRTFDGRTKKLIASRCCESVLRSAKVFAGGGGSECFLWHIDDAGAPAGKPLMPDAPSVTLSALFLAHFMGYRNITVYGWDGCYIDGKHHAIDQAHDAETLQADIDGELFTTTYAWLAEAEDAVKAINMLPDIDITVEGPGMIAKVIRPIMDHRRAANVEAESLRRSFEEGEGVR